MASSLRIATLALLFSVFSFLPEAAAQDLSPRFGLGLGGVLSTEEGVGLNLNGRASAPVNSDFSVAIDLGLTGYVLGGRDSATYTFDPQVAAVVNLTPTEQYLPYLLAGLGAHLPLSDADDTSAGPVLHVGYGRVQPLQDSSLYYEINPGLLIGEEGVDFLIPVRVGLIFR